MKVFRDLYLSGSDTDLKATVEAIEDSLSEGWQRSREAEERVRAMAVGREATYCFTCEANGNRPAARLFLMEDDGSLAVTNIVPKETGRLSYDQYNAVLEEFYERFARPAAKKTGVDVRITSDEKSIDAWLGEDAAKKLRRFASLANKSTGSAHPYDRDRWFAFLLAAHEQDSLLDSSTLARWLVETEHWGKDAASDLAIEYEFGRELLSFADAHRNGE